MNRCFLLWFICLAIVFPVFGGEIHPNAVLGSQFPAYSKNEKAHRLRYVVKIWSEPEKIKDGYCVSDVIELVYKKNNEAIPWKQENMSLVDTINYKAIAIVGRDTSCKNIDEEQYSLIGYQNYLLDENNISILEDVKNGIASYTEFNEENLICKSVLESFALPTNIRVSYLSNGGIYFEAVVNNRELNNKKECFVSGIINENNKVKISEVGQIVQ